MAIDKLERALVRLSTALDEADEEIALLAATTLRTLLVIAERDDIEPARLAPLRSQCLALLERAPHRLHGANAVFRLLARSRDPSV